MVLGAKLPPPKPGLRIEVVKLHQNRGVMLSWDIREAGDSAPLIPGKYAKIVKYQLYAYQVSYSKKLLVSVDAAAKKK